MKTSASMKLKSVLLSSLFMVLCLGQNASATDSTTTKVQVHVPWNLLSERLRTIGQSNNSSLQKVLESEQIKVEGLDWLLSKIEFSAKLSIDRALVNETGASVALSNSQLSIKVNQISVDQIVERDIGGVIARVHVVAKCGPLAIRQNGASAQGDFSFDWSHGDVDTSVSNVDLQWAPGSWTFDPFNCEGPSGLDTLLHDEIAKRLEDPAIFKPYLVSFLSTYLKSQTTGVLRKIREPLTLKAGTGVLNASVGRLFPVSTGVVANVTIGKVLAADSSSEEPLPSASTLTRLPVLGPAFVGDLKMLEFLIKSELANHPEYLSVDLQKVSAFHKLMKSRFLQFFVWRDLFHFPKANPFFLRIQNPRELTLTKSSSGLSSKISLNAVVQAYRDSQWWSYVTTQSKASTSIDLSMKDGVLTYVTNVDDLDGTLAYGSEYKARFKPSGSPPSKTVKKAMLGTQPALSGTIAFPLLELGAAGKFKALNLNWLDTKNFYISFAQANQ